MSLQKLSLLVCGLLSFGLLAACTPGPKPAQLEPNCLTPGAGGQGAACPGSPTPDDAAAANTVRIEVGDDWQQAVDDAPEGTTFTIATGIHRLVEVVPKAGDTFVGEPGAIMSGAKVLTEFSAEGPYWVADAALTYRGGIQGECVDNYDGCGYPEDLFIDDEIVRHVTSLDQVEPGNWYLDYEANKVYLGDNPTGRKVELSAWEHAFIGTADNVTIRGLIIEKYAAPAQRGAIHARNEEDGSLGANWVVEQNEIRMNHGAGIRLGAGMQVLRNKIHHNGQIGITGGESTGIVVEGNEIAFNNTAGFSGYWEAGGTKFSYTEDLVVRNNYVHDNNGPGLWTDIDNVNTLYENNNVENNDLIGIQHEISYSAVIRNNVVRNNGGNINDWLWGAQIMISGSSDVEVYGNTVVSRDIGGQGIAVTQDNRESYRTRNVYVHHNEIAGPGINGADENPADPAMYDSVLFDYNNYHGADTWFWNGAVDFAGFQAAGQEQNGTTNNGTAWHQDDRDVPSAMQAASSRAEGPRSLSPGGDAMT